MLVSSPFTGLVVEVVAGEGTPVAAEAPVLVLESMKMHHEVTAPLAGVVQDLAVGAGDQVQAGEPLFRLEPARVAAGPGVRRPAAGPGARADLREVLARRERLLDSARPHAVERRRSTGRRTVRENVEDLLDPGSLSEYGGLAIAAQRARRPLEDLLDATPADGIITGIGSVDGSPCAVLAYDPTVLAGTQGIRGHRKADRLLDLAAELRLPVVLFAEGGGGRPGDTDSSELFHLIVPTFRGFARLSGLVPRIGIVAGNCFAGNASLLGCCDVIIATPQASIGMGGPAMIEGGGLGTFAPADVGPLEIQVPNGVVDLVAGDEAEAVALARQLLALLTGQVAADWSAPDQHELRTVVPEDPKRVHDVRRLLGLLADEGSVLELRRDWGRTIVTALARVEGRPVGVIANDPAHLSGAIDSDGSTKAARFIQLCDAFGLPVLSLVDTPGFMVGPDSERTGLVRHSSRLFTAAATATVPFVCVVVRRAYGLGAQAMAGGHLRAPLVTLAWPTGEFGAMGVEGAVRLGLRRELEAVEDEQEREQRVRDLVAAVRSQSTALNMATFFEIDDVIDPADTRTRVVAALRAVPPMPPGGRRRTMVDAW